MKSWTCILLLALPVAAQQPELPKTSDHRPLALLAATASAERVPVFERFELTLNLAATYDNAFDPEQISVVTAFTSPGGQTVKVDGFFYQPYRPKPGQDALYTPCLRDDGEPCFKVRFAPTEPGTWTYRVSARDRSGQVSAPEGRFIATAPRLPGYIRVSPHNRRTFEYDNGAAFFPVGQNLQNDWPDYRKSKPLAESACNAVRAWTFCHWTWLEWTFRPEEWGAPGHYARAWGGAGQFNQRIAWLADQQLDRWAADGLRVMMCMGNGNELNDAARYDGWGGHPYSRANGGFLNTGAEFWTDRRAIDLYRRKLRYIVARWGWSPSIWAWEFFNELGTETDATVAWHRDMAAYLKAIDLGRHLATTSFWVEQGMERTWALPGMDFTQTHTYAEPDTIRLKTATMLALAPKPTVNGEGGGAGPGRDKDSDPQGLDIHNALWAAPLSGAAGATLPWWWRERIGPHNLFYNYTAIARFAADVPWNMAPWKPLAPGDVRITGPVGDATPRPVLIHPLGPGWGQKASRTDFTVEGDGHVDGIAEFSPVLFGSGRREWTTAPIVKIDCPVAGRLVTRISEASGAMVEIDLDGRTMIHDDTFRGPRQSYQTDLTVELTAGRHTVVWRNAGNDWARIDYLLLTAYRDPRRYSDLEVYGLTAGPRAVLWVHHRQSIATFVALGLKPQPVPTATAVVPDLPAGRYNVAWWDTRQGTSRTEELTASAGGLTLALPPVSDDIACRIEPRGLDVAGRLADVPLSLQAPYLAEERQ